MQVNGSCVLDNSSLVRGSEIDVAQWVFSRTKQALMLEKEETGYLLHNLSSKDQAQNVFEVLLHFAQVDGHLAAEEEQLLSDFALRWEIPYAADNAMTYQSSTVQMSHAMHAIQKFLASAPSAVQSARIIISID